jgi:hypothetical protein
VNVFRKFAYRAMGLVAAMALILAVGSASAQETTGSISGTITDSTGAKVKGAVVALINMDRGQEVRSLTTNDTGFYSATSLPLGTYTVKVTVPGFKTESVTGLVLHANDSLTVNRTLQVGSSEQSITVNASLLNLNLENANSEGLINGTQMRELVLNNRNYEQLILLQPGVAYAGANDQLYIGVSLPSGSSNQVAFSVNGQRTTQNNWTVDGADNVDRGANLTLLTFPSVDAIAEFKTVRGTYTAQFGRAASGVVNVVTRSGTNTLHGSAYEFFRNDVFNANAMTNNLNGVSRPLLRYNDFGYTVGGPVYLPKIYDGRDKTFFFVSQEFRRVINYSTFNVTVPTALERQGDFSQSPIKNSAGVYVPGPVYVCTSANPSTGACLTYGTKVTSISPTAQAYLKDIYAGVPLPNTPYGTAIDPHQLTTNIRNVFNNNQTFVRIDQALGQKANIFYRYLHDTLPSTEGAGLFGGGTALPGVQTSSTTAPGTQHLGHVTYVFNPTLLMNVGYAYSYGALISDPIGTNAIANSPDIKPTLPFGSALGVIPGISIANGTGITTVGKYRDYNYNHNIFGDVTKTWGRHVISVGATYNHYRKSENALGNGSPYPQGQFTFSATNIIASPPAGGSKPTNFEQSFSFFLNGVANGGFTQASSVFTPDIRQNQFEAYVQDDWKVTPRLTVNAGVRYTLFAQPTEAAGHVTNFDPSTFKASAAPTVDSNGLLCLTGTCANKNNLNSGAPNPNADLLNGVVLGTPASNGHPSTAGSAFGTTQKLNFAPRLGFAFDPFGDGKTSIRGGYGIAFDSGPVSMYETAVFSNLPYVTVPTYSSASFDNPAAGNPQTNLTPPTLSVSPIHFKTPYAQQFSLDVQRQITPSMMLDMGYFGASDVHLLGRVDLNTVRPGAFIGKLLPGDVAGSSCTITNPNGTKTPAFISTTCDRGLNQIRPYVGYSAVNAVLPIFNANYNSLQVKFQKRFSGATLIDFNYTYSKGLTNSQNDYGTAPQNVYDINADYGRSAVDRRHIFTADAVWEIPWGKAQNTLASRILGGWELSGIFTMNSGLPLTVTASGGSALVNTAGTIANDAAGLGILGASAAGLRPDMLRNPNLPGNKRGYLHWFDVDAFAAPSPTSYRVGNERRGVITGPGYVRVDPGVFRNFRIYHESQLQIRAEAYNVLNHVNYQGVQTSSSSATFGQITSVRDPRILQVAAKFTF